MNRFEDNFIEFEEAYSDQPAVERIRSRKNPGNRQRRVLEQQTRRFIKVASERAVERETARELEIIAEQTQTNLLPRQFLPGLREDARFVFLKETEPLRERAKDQRQEIAHMLCLEMVSQSTDA